MEKLRDKSVVLQQVIETVEPERKHAKPQFETVKRLFDRIEEL